MGKRLNGEGSQYKRRDGRFERKVRMPDGSRPSIYGRTQAELLANVKVVLDHYKETGSLPDKKLTVAIYLDEWLDRRERLGDIRFQTLYGYRSKVKTYIKPKIGHVLLTELSPRHVEKMIDWMLTEQKDDKGKVTRKALSASTIRQTVAILNKACNVAARREIISVNKVGKAKDSVPKATKTKIVPLTNDEAIKLIESTQTDRLAALYKVALYLGLRAGEIMGLKWEDLDLEAGTLHMERGIGWKKGEGLVETPPKSDTSKRPLPLFPLVTESLKAHKKAQAAERLKAGADWQDHGYVFTTRTGSPMHYSNFNRRQFRPALRRAGLRDVRFHDLRHSCATLLLSAGASLHWVKEYLGHAQITLTSDTYGHMMEETRKEMGEMMSAIADRIENPGKQAEG